MNPILRDILDLLDVERIEENLYRGRNAAESEHVFGGQVLAQAIAAAYRTIEDNAATAFDPRVFPAARRLECADPLRGGPHPRRQELHHPPHRGDPARPRDLQHASSWQKDEPGLEHSVAMPDVPTPESLRSDKEAYAEIAKVRPEVKRFAYRFDAIDSRQVENILMGDNSRRIRRTSTRG